MAGCSRRRDSPPRPSGSSRSTRTTIASSRRAELAPLREQLADLGQPPPRIGPRRRPLRGPPPEIAERNRPPRIPAGRSLRAAAAALAEQLSRPARTCSSSSTSTPTAGSIRMIWPSCSRSSRTWTSRSRSTSRPKAASAATRRSKSVARARGGSRRATGRQSRRARPRQHAHHRFRQRSGRPAAARRRCRRMAPWPSATPSASWSTTTSTPCSKRSTRNADGRLGEREISTSPERMLARDKNGDGATRERRIAHRDDRRLHALRAAERSTRSTSPKTRPRRATSGRRRNPPGSPKPTSTATATSAAANSWARSNNSQNSTPTTTRSYRRRSQMWHRFKRFRRSTRPCRRPLRIRRNEVGHVHSPIPGTTCAGTTCRAEEPRDDAFLKQYAETYRFTLGQPTDVPSHRRRRRGAVPALRPAEFRARSVRVRCGDRRGAAAGVGRKTSRRRRKRSSRPRSWPAASGCGRRPAASPASNCRDDGRQVLVPLSGSLVRARSEDASRELRPSRQPLPKGARLVTRSMRDSRPTARSIAGVRDGDLYVIDVASGESGSSRRGATETLSHGVAEFVAQEEMDRMHGYWWSPDSKRSRTRKPTHSASKSCTSPIRRSRSSRPRPGAIRGPARKTRACGWA